MPALLMRMSSLPNSAFGQGDGSLPLLFAARRRGTRSAQPRPREAATFSPSSSRTSPSTTRAPSATKRRASASPCPRAAPVIKATLPFNLCPIGSTPVAAARLSPAPRRWVYERKRSAGELLIGSAPGRRLLGCREGRRRLAKAIPLLLGDRCPRCSGRRPAPPRTPRRRRGRTRASRRRGHLLRPGRPPAGPTCPRSSGRTASSSSTRACGSRSAPRSRTTRRRPSTRRRRRRTAASRTSGPTGASRATWRASPSRWRRSTAREIPRRASKLAWNHDSRWEGAGRYGSGRYTYWDRGEQLPLYYEGWGRNVLLAHRPEPQYADKGGDLFRGERAEIRLRDRRGRALRRQGHRRRHVSLQVGRRSAERPRGTTTRGSTCRRSGACAASRRRSAPTPCRARTSPSTT